MQKELLTKLLHDLEQEMLRLGYTKGTMKFYCRRWKMLCQFAQEQGEMSGTIDFFRQTTIGLGEKFRVKRVLCYSGFYDIKFIKHLESESKLI